MLFFIVRSIIALIILFFSLAVIEIIPHIGSRLTVIRVDVFVRYLRFYLTFHNVVCFW